MHREKERRGEERREVCAARAVFKPDVDFESAPSSAASATSDRRSAIKLYPGE